jgi:hypothetical protein
MRFARGQGLSVRLLYDAHAIHTITAPVPKRSGRALCFDDAHLIRCLVP